MTPPRSRPPFVADERTQLVSWLDLQRAVVHFKCEGLTEQDAHRSVLPTSPLMTMAGLVSHLRWVEHWWFEVMFLNRSAETNPQVGAIEDADFLVAGMPLAQLLEEYEHQCARSNEIIIASSLDAVGQHPDFGSAAATLRWMLIHMVEETGRHVGQMDTIRELLDGEKGYY